MAALSGTPISYAWQDANLRFQWFENPPLDWNAAAAVGGSDTDLFPEEVAATLLGVKRDVIARGVSMRREINLANDSGPRDYDVYLQPDCDTSGAVVGVLSIIVDVTDRRRSEEARNTLLREVTHRSKNLLAIVTSLAAQTSRTAFTIDDFLERFNGRLHSMARSQDIVTATNWRGARLSELVATQVEPFVPKGTGAVVFDGFDPYLTPNAALYIGLALHELTANSLRNGALAFQGGTVSVSVTTPSGQIDDQPALAVTWREEQEGGVEGPDANEFGHVLLTRLVPAAVGGTAALDESDQGLRYQVTLRRQEFE